MRGEGARGTAQDREIILRQALRHVDQFLRMKLYPVQDAVEIAVEDKRAGASQRQLHGSAAKPA